MPWPRRKRDGSNPRPARVAPRQAPLRGPFPAGSPGDRFDLVLVAAGEKKILVIKVIRECTGYGLKQAKDVVDASAYGPVVLAAGLPLFAANRAAAALTQVGATAAVNSAAETGTADWP